MEVKSPYKLMLESDALKSQVYVIRLIANDLSKTLLIKDFYIAKDRKELNEIEFSIERYSFDLDAIIMEIMGFNSDLIDKELGFWYYKQINQALKFRDKFNIDYILEHAVKIFFSLKKLQNFPNDKIKTEICKQLNVSEESISNWVLKTGKE